MRNRPHVRRVVERRPDWLTFEVWGHLDAEDMRHMADQVGEAFERHGKIDMLVLFRPYEGATAGALVEPHALKVEAASVTHVRRYAVVGAPGWARAIITLGGTLSPVDAKTFAPDEEREARAWIDEP